MATAAETGWPPKVNPWAKLAVAFQEGLDQPLAGDHGADG